MEVTEGIPEGVADVRTTECTGLVCVEKEDEEEAEDSIVVVVVVVFSSLFGDTFG